MSEKIEKARILADLGRYDGARELLAQVLAGEPENAAALAVMADVAYRMGDFGRALELVDSVLRLFPDSVFALRMRAYAAFRQAATAPEHSTERRELSVMARSAARRALDIDADDAENHVTFGLVYARKDGMAALAAIDRALELDPENVRAFQVRSHIYRTAFPDKDRATDALREVLRLDPENAAAVHELGRIEAQAGNLDEAAARLLEAGRLDPADAGSVRQDLEWVRARQARQPRPKPEEQRPRRDSRRVDAAILAELRRCDEARWASAEPADIERAVARLAQLRDVHPDDADILYESALADWLCGRRRAAITRLRRVSRLAPGRAHQVNAHIATLEAEDQQVAEALAAQREVRARRAEHKAETQVERAAEAAIARRRARERVKARRAQAGGSNRADLDAAVRVERPGAAARNKRHWLVVVPLIFLVKMSLHGCATDNSHQGTDRQRSVYTPTTMDPDVLRRLIETPGPSPR